MCPARRGGEERVGVEYDTVTKKRAPVLSNPYAAGGRWWKVAIHCHTTNSDGHISPGQAIRIYRRQGCHALAITDHEHVTRFPGHRGRPLLIPSAEVSAPEDTLYLGATETGPLDIAGRGLQATIDLITRRGGVAVVAHPSWSDLTTPDLLKVRGYVALEAYNQVCQDLNGKGRSVEIWDHLLTRGRRVWGFADDDAHFDPGGGRGSAGHAWLWVKARRLSVAGILASLRSGSFHATQGPRIFSVDYRRGRFTIRTSPVARLHMISAQVGAGGAWFSRSRRGDTVWRVDILKQRLNVTRYVRFEAVDARGRTAWSNPLYVKGSGIRFW